RPKDHQRVVSLARGVPGRGGGVFGADDPDYGGAAPGRDAPAGRGDGAMSSMISIRGLSKSFGANPVLRGIDFEVAESQVVVVIGPSGSGKSTLLRCCNGLEVAEQGSIEICG